MPPTEDSSTLQPRHQPADRLGLDHIVEAWPRLASHVLESVLTLTDAATAAERERTPTDDVSPDGSVQPHDANARRQRSANGLMTHRSSARP